MHFRPSCIALKPHSVFVLDNSTGTVCQAPGTFWDVRVWVAGLTNIRVTGIIIPEAGMIESGPAIECPMPRMKGFYKILQQPPRHHDSANLKILYYFWILDIYVQQVFSSGVIKRRSYKVIGGRGIAFVKVDPCRSLNSVGSPWSTDVSLRFGERSALM